MRTYKIPSELNDLIEENLKVDLCFEDDGEFFIEELTLERMQKNEIPIDQFFMDHFSKNAKNYLEQYAIYEYRVRELVKNEFKHNPIGSINFKDQLKDNVALVKNEPVFDNRERPVYVDYDFDDVLISRIKWEFTLNPENNFPSRKKVFLAYYREDNSLGEFVLIEDEKYKDPRKILDDLEKPRENRIKKLKLLMIKNIEVSDPNLDYSQVLVKVSRFFVDYSSAINVFIKTGVSYDSNDSNFLVNKILIDSDTSNGEAKYPFLNHPYFMDNSYTLGQVIISQVNY